MLIWTDLCTSSSARPLRRDQIEHLAYNVARLLAGERTATSEWQHLGLTIEVEPDSDGGPEG